ncbi:restriction endonuclease subunit S [Brevibacillus migulae]|uniref:restriction endonuclease subunit S n=1 Tax=Brevibacillus migulae TaxID=1644114 RepID=UPI00106E2145|nr:restriction endonuclease subunit S [Brevibacillus migulae]
MTYTMVHLGEITINADSRRKPLNERQRAAISKEKRYPYIGANNIIDYVDEYLFDEKILCVAEDGGYWGAGEHCAFLYEGKCWVNNHAHVLLETSHAKLEYVRFYLNHADLSSHITGTTRGKLTKADLERIILPLPSIPEQEKLVAIFQEADDLINKRKEALLLQDQLLQSYFHERFGDLVQNPKSFEIFPLQELCDVRDGTHESPRYVQAGYPLITSRNLAGGDIDFRGAKCISEKDFHEINKRSKVDRGDILLPMIGTIGNPVLVQTDAAFAIKNVALLKFPDQGRITNRYMKGVLDSHYFTNWVEKVHRGGTQRFISLGDLRAMPIPLPPLREQMAFGQLAEHIERQKRMMQAQLTALEEQAQSIRHCAFQGKLTG